MSRLALICNMAFLACLVFQHTPDLHLPQLVNGTILVLGWFVAVFLNFALVIAYLINAIRKRVLNIKPWLIITNVLFFIAQILIQLIFVQ